jgi:hypothetical protein
MPGLLKESLLLNKDFREILSFFCDEKVEFMLVGAYALAAHGLPRATGDIDSGFSAPLKTPNASGAHLLILERPWQISR